MQPLKGDLPGGDMMGGRQDKKQKDKLEDFDYCPDGKR